MPVFRKDDTTAGFSQGTLNGVQAVGNTLKLSGALPSQGSRVTPDIDLGSAGNMVIKNAVLWNATVPANTDLTVETSLNGDAWQGVSNGSPIPLKQGLYHDGVDDYIPVPAKAIYAQSNNVTYEFSFNCLKDIEGVNVAMFSLGDYNNIQFSCTPRYNMVQTQIWMNVSGSTGWRYTNCNVGFDYRNVKITFTITFENGLLKQYINGVLKNSYNFGSGSYIVCTASSVGNIGSYFRGRATFLSGYIYYIRVYNAVLSPDEVLANYQGNIRLSNRIADWRFNEGKGTTVYDYSLTANHLTIPSTYLMPWTPLTGDFTGKVLRVRTTLKSESVTAEPVVSILKVVVNTKEQCCSYIKAEWIDVAIARKVKAIRNSIISAKAMWIKISRRVWQFLKVIVSINSIAVLTRRLAMQSRDFSFIMSHFVVIINRMVIAKRKAEIRISKVNMGISWLKILIGKITFKGVLNKVLVFIAVLNMKPLFFTGRLQKTIRSKVVLDLDNVTTGSAYTIVQGETKLLELEITDSNNLPVDLVGAVVRFAIDTYPQINKACMNMGLGVVQAKLEPNDTKDIRPGTYSYEFRVKDGNGDVESIIRGELIIARALIPSMDN